MSKTQTLFPKEPVHVPVQVEQVENEKQPENELVEGLNVKLVVALRLPLVGIFSRPMIGTRMILVCAMLALLIWLLVNHGLAQLVDDVLRLLSQTMF
jgi:hypothetical protein